MAVAVEYKLIC